MEIKILEERCKGCGLCIAFCPKKILGFSNKRNAQGYKVIAFLNKDTCNKCGICFLMCPDVVFVAEDES